MVKLSNKPHANLHGIISAEAENVNYEASLLCSECNPTCYFVGQDVSSYCPSFKQQAKHAVKM
jgi:hypothetical protein